MATDQDSGKPAQPADPQRPEGPSASVVIPVVEEQVVVDRNTVETGRVRVTTTTHEEERRVDEPILQDVVQVERVPVNREVDGPVSVRKEGDTTIIPVLEEQVVVVKRLVLKEELRVTRTRVESRYQQSIPVRSQEVLVERVPPGAPASASGQVEAGAGRGRKGP